MTATKDELLRYQHNRITALISSISNINPDYPEKRKPLEYQLKLTTRIKQILNLHFSISDSERKEAREWVKRELALEGEIGCSIGYQKLMKTILKALGEEK